MPGPSDAVVIANVASPIVIDQGTASVDSLSLSNATIDTKGTARFFVGDSAELSSASILASDGGQVEINDRSIRITGQNRATIHADGLGSSISAPMENSLFGRWVVMATNGGHINLPELTSVSSLAIGFSATGGSRMTLGTLARLPTRISGEVVLDDSEIFGNELWVERWYGNGTIHGDLIQTGEIHLDGQLSITGDVAASSSGFLTVGLLGPNDITPLNVGGTASFDDFNLRVELLDEYVPAVGESFEFLNAAMIVGAFQNVETNATGAGVGFEASTNSGTGVVTAVPDSGPSITGIEASSLTESLTGIVVSFSEPISVDSISNSGITLEGPNGPITDLSVGIDSDPSKIRISMNTPAPAGTYSLAVHPLFTDINGNLFDQDGDGIGGEPTEDIYFKEFVVEDNDGPYVVLADDIRNGQGTIGQLEVSFSSTTDTGSFTADDLTVLDSDRQPIDVQPTIEPQDSFGLDYTITFGKPVWKEGEYEIRIGPDVLDISGNAMDQDEDGVFGEVADDGFLQNLEVKRPEPIPGISGNGVFTEIFLSVEEDFQFMAVESAMLSGRSPDATGRLATIDFPNSADFVSTSRGATIDEFFSGTFPLTEEQEGTRAGVFMLRNTFYLIVTAEADLNPNTPEIDIRTGVGSDDGYLLTIDEEFVSMNRNRSWRYTWDSLRFQEPGIYPVELIYSANALGQAGLEFAWETATSGGEQIVPTDFLYFDNSLLFAGDADLNGTVNSTDLGLLLNNFNDDSGLGWQGGNFNDDMFVDSTDLGLLLNHFGQDENVAANVALANAAFAELGAEDDHSQRIYAPIDALRIINHLNQLGNLTDAEHDALDFDGNGEIVPLDALMVINRLNTQQSTAAITESDALQIRAAAIQHVIDTSFFNDCNISNPCDSDPRWLIFLAESTNSMGYPTGYSSVSQSLLEKFASHYDVAQFSDGEEVYNGYHLINENVTAELERGPLYHTDASIRRIDGVIEIDAGSYLGNSGATGWTIQLEPTDTGWEVTNAKLNWIV